MCRKRPVWVGSDVKHAQATHGQALIVAGLNLTRRDFLGFGLTELRAG
jgi:hypothetical protein